MSILLQGGRGVERQAPEKNTAKRITILMQAHQQYEPLL